MPPVFKRETEQVAYGVKLTLQSTPPASALGPPDEYQFRRELALPVRLDVIHIISVVIAL